MLGGGQGKFEGRIFRVGHMGWVSQDDVENALDVVERLLQEAHGPHQRAHLLPPAHPENDPPHHVEDVMSTLSLTVSPADDLSDAVELMTTPNRAASEAVRGTAVRVWVDAWRRCRL